MGEDDARRLRCPYCGYTCESSGIGAVYCGPHRASFGPNTYPAVRMVEVQSGPSQKEAGNGDA